MGTHERAAAELAAYEDALLRRVALYLRAAATELEQVRSVIETRQERNQHLAYCHERVETTGDLLEQMLRASDANSRLVASQRLAERRIAGG